MDADTERRIKDAIAYEFDREEVPEGFEDLPPIPASRYIDPAFFELEKKHIFRKSWFLAGHMDQLPEVGSYFLWEDSGSPILIARGKDDVVRAFYNTCQHRGAPVVRDSAGKVSRFRCQYHSWTYELDGSLVAVPDRRDFRNLDFSCRGLVSVRCELWGGFIFVNEDLDAPPLLEWLGPVPGELDDWGIEDLRFAERHSIDLACNWKVAIDAFMEVYHLKHIHPNTVDRLLDHRGTAMGLLPNGHSRMPSPIRPENLVDGNVPSDFTAIESVGEVGRITNLAYSLFPNFVTPLDPTGFPVLIFWPVDIKTTRMDVLWFGPDWGDELPDMWKGRIRIFDMVLDEDTQNLAWIQKSLDTPAFTSIPLSYQERRIYHFHEQVDKMIGVENIPEAQRVTPRLEKYVEG